MASLPTLQSRTIPLNSLSEDRSCAVSPPWWEPDSRLADSIAQHGVLVPVRVRRSDSDLFQLLSGFQRIAVCRRLDIPEVPALVKSAGTREEDFLETIGENASSGKMSEIEEAHIVAKLRQEYLFDEERILNEVFPLLGIRRNRQQIKLRLQWASLPQHLQEAVAGDFLRSETAVSLARFERSDQEFFLDVSQDLRLGVNKQRQLLELLEELAHLRKSPLRAIWNDLDLPSLLRDEPLPPSVRFQRIRETLYEARYPRLSSHRERARHILSELSLPPEVQIVVPPFFEGQTLELTLRAKSSEAMRQQVEILRNRLESNLFDELYALL